LSHSYPNLKQTKLLYVGRIKVEKGIFSLIEILKQVDIDFELSIVGKPKGINIDNKIKYYGYENHPEQLKKIYDNHNIFILPSFTEGHPQALDESLARQRPAIVFQEINHVIESRSGVFISKRESSSLIETINLIMSNYENIFNSIKKNKLPTKEKFIEQMTDILNKN
jgi:glycosyltransferase involved in cell wall biosynthesis